MIVLPNFVKAISAASVSFMLSAAFIAAARVPAGATGFGYVPLVHLPIPPAPVLTAIAGSTIPPHSDYVRITYVGATGETTASAESVFSASANTLTVVHSPPIEPGAIGYNVYAIQNSGGSGTGHVLQNAVPIAIGTDYTERLVAWTRATRPPPTVNSASIPMPETVVPISSAGGYVEAPIVNGAKAALDLPSSDAPPSTEVSLTSASGALPDRIVPQVVPLDAADKTSVIATIGFAFTNDVTFAGLPTFKLTLPRGELSPAPYFVRLYDGATRALLATMPAFTYDRLAFLSDYGAPVRMSAFHRYYAELVANSPSAASAALPTAAGTIAFPAADGISLAVKLPAGTVTPGSVYGMYASNAPPVGLPPIGGSDVQKALYYASVTITGSVAYSAPATLTVTLPASPESNTKSVKLAVYDSQFARAGWAVRLGVTHREGRLLTFEATLPTYLGWRQYGIVLYASNDRRDANDAIASTPPAARTPLVVVLGDSMSLLTIIPPSGAGCSPGWAPLPDCQYSKEPTRTWPGQLAKFAHVRVINLSAQGTQTVANSYAGESMLDMMVPQIPPSTQVVVCQCGVNDLSYNQQSPATSARAAVITKAILERAPQAHIVYMGLRCFNGCNQTAIDAWNQADRTLATRYGAFVDLIPFAPAGSSAAFPDGTHPTPDTAKKIAMEAADAMAAWIK